MVLSTLFMKSKVPQRSHSAGMSFHYSQPSRDCQQQHNTTWVIEHWNILAASCQSYKSDGRVTPSHPWPRILTPLGPLERPAELVMHELSQWDTARREEARRGEKTKGEKRRGEDLTLCCRSRSSAQPDGMKYLQWYHLLNRTGWQHASNYPMT